MKLIFFKIIVEIGKLKNKAGSNKFKITAQKWIKEKME